MAKKEPKIKKDKKGKESGAEYTSGEKEVYTEMYSSAEQVQTKHSELTGTETSVPSIFIRLRVNANAQDARKKLYAALLNPALVSELNQQSKDSSTDLLDYITNQVISEESKEKPKNKPMYKNTQEGMVKAKAVIGRITAAHVTEALAFLDNKEGRMIELDSILDPSDNNTLVKLNQDQIQQLQEIFKEYNGINSGLTLTRQFALGKDGIVYMTALGTQIHKQNGRFLLANAAALPIQKEIFKAEPEIEKLYESFADKIDKLAPGSESSIKEVALYGAILGFLYSNGKQLRLERDRLETIEQKLERQFNRALNSLNNASMGIDAQNKNAQAFQNAIRLAGFTLSQQVLTGLFGFLINTETYVSMCRKPELNTLFAQQQLFPLLRTSTVNTKGNPLPVHPVTQKSMNRAEYLAQCCKSVFALIANQARNEKTLTNDEKKVWASVLCYGQFLAEQSGLDEMNDLFSTNDYSVLLADIQNVNIHQMIQNFMRMFYSCMESVAEDYQKLAKIAGTEAQQIQAKNLLQIVAMLEKDWVMNYN